MALLNSGRPRLLNTSTVFSFIMALAIVFVTFVCTRIMDETFSHCEKQPKAVRMDPFQMFGNFEQFGSSIGALGQAKSWPEQGYGTQLRLRIYIYEDWEISGLKHLMTGRDENIDAGRCVKGQWGTQVKIHHLLLKSKLRTLQKEAAQLFFVPCYVKCVRMFGGLDDREINDTFVHILQQMPYFRRSGGRDHVFVFPSGAGAHLFKDWAIYLNRSIFLTPEGDRTDKRGTSAFHTWKDIIIPGNVDEDILSATSSFIKPMPLSQRRFLANFLGRAQGKTGRLKLIELAKQFPDKLEVPELSFSGPLKLGRKEYFEHLRNSKFCLAPRGESSWTLRFYESFFVECVPVILSDQIELPFQNVLDYSQFSIKWPSTMIDERLVGYLSSIPDNDVELMLERGRSIRCLFIYAPESRGCTAMTGISWELQRKVRLFQQSAETFWLHNGSVVDRRLREMRSWHSPLTLP